MYSNSFDNKKETSFEQERIDYEKKIDQLYNTIGQITVDVNWLKKNLSKLLDLAGKKELVTKDDPKPNLSIPNKQHKVYPYLLRHLTIDRPNQVWSIDIMHIPLGRSFMYLTAIIDWHSRYIVGYELSDTLQVESVIACVKKAIAIYGTPEIINSDQGSQFTSLEYINLLKHHSIKISMDGKGRWADNIIIERFFRTLKYDDIYVYHYQTPRELRAGINKFMKSYNEEHPHSTHQYKMPYEMYHGIKAA